MVIEIIDNFRNTFTEHAIFSVGFLMICGYIFGYLSEKIKLPAITGYIIAGIIVGDSGLKFIHAPNSELLHNLSEVTLSFIAVIIGGEFSFSKLKRYGKKVIIIAFTQMLFAFALVSTGLILVGLPQYAAFLLGAISAATAPAATVVIIEKLKAKGEFVDYLYGIVALDDAGTIILFSVVFAFSVSAFTGDVPRLELAVWHAFKEIVVSVIIGTIAGFIIHYSTIRKNSTNEIKIISLGIMLISTSIAISLHVSALIANMTIGMILINMSRKNLRIFTAFEPLTPPLYAVFFAVAGTELNVQILKDPHVLLAGAVYILMRGLGKYLGIFTGAVVTKSPEVVRKYLGLSMLPQAGVAIGLSLFIQASPLLKTASDDVKLNVIKIINIVSVAVFFNELIGPPLSEIAILKSLKRR
ncbi:MAG: cation:proton antiporter [Candidatus Cloacimonetes bacterium]|nr:cation:proton antiporter [Candidatus Cloacimonadota bacterium]